MKDVSKKETGQIAKAKPVKMPPANKKASAKSAAPDLKSKSQRNANRVSKAKDAIKGVKKKYLKSEICKVTFRLPREAAPAAERVTIVGDFNQWDLSESEMKRMRNGDFQLTIELSCNREYRFKYLIDSNKWENDWCADKYTPNPFGGDDSVVVI